jgi:hypothetical protein
VTVQPSDVNTITLRATRSSGKSPLGSLCIVAFVAPRALVGERANCSVFEDFVVQIVGIEVFEEEL